MVGLFASPNCSGAPLLEFDFPSMCYLEENDDSVDDQYPTDDTYTDTYLPPIFNPPPSVSTTPFPTSKGAARSTAVFCTFNEPTLKPVGQPTLSPSLAPPVAPSTTAPTYQPNATPRPTAKPSFRPSATPQPSELPTTAPTDLPSIAPTMFPTRALAKESTFAVSQVRI